MTSSDQLTVIQVTLLSCFSAPGCVRCLNPTSVHIGQSGKFAPRGRDIFENARPDAQISMLVLSVAQICTVPYRALLTAFLPAFPPLFSRYFRVFWSDFLPLKFSIFNVMVKVL